jgi:hypothetical protein
MKCKINECTNLVYSKDLCCKHYKRLQKHGNYAGIKPHGTPEERFWNFVEKKSESECWNWLGSLRAGYGRISLGSKKDGVVSSHRFSWELHNKKSIPDGMVVMHSCDNPKCVNPNHLNIGSHKDNTQDMIAKGRKVVVAPLGNENGKAIINAEIVKAIRQSNLSHAELGRQFNISSNCVRGVRTGRTGSHIT